jgi:hypothetical protein
MPAKVHLPKQRKGVKKMEFVLHHGAETTDEIDLLGCSYNFFLVLVEPIDDDAGDY